MPRRNPLEQAAELAPGLARRPDKPERRQDQGGQTWDQAHKAASFRIRAVDAARLEDQARELGLSKDAMSAALLWAALDALEAGWLTLEPETLENEITDAKGRRRLYLRRQARPVWQGPALPVGNDSSG